MEGNGPAGFEMDSAGANHAARDLRDALDFPFHPDQLGIRARECATKNKRRENSGGRGKHLRFGHQEKTKISLPETALGGVDQKAADPAIFHCGLCSTTGGTATVFCRAWA